VVRENGRQNDMEAEQKPPTDGKSYEVASLDLSGVQEDR
jgi:hypothetical protein